MNNFWIGFEKRAKEHAESEEHEAHESKKEEKEEHEKEADASGLMGAAKGPGKVMKFLSKTKEHLRDYHPSYLRGGTAAGSLATAYGVNKKHKKED